MKDWILKFRVIIKEKVLKFEKEDDRTIKIANKNTNACISTLTKVTQALEDWTRSWRMVINCDPNKTEFICFNKAQKDIEIPESIMLTGKEVKQVEQTKVLGLYIDSKLSYIPHAKAMHKRLLDKWVKICQYCNIHWGFSQRVLTQIINTNFVTTMQYAGHIYINSKNMKDINHL